MTVGFIGAGNMGGALATAVARAIGGERVVLADACTEKAAALAASIGARAADNDTVIDTCDYVFLGVKPQVMDSVLASLRESLSARKTPCVLVSMAAGLSVAALEEMAGVALPIIRIMPNTPVAVGEGMILYAHNDSVDTAQVDGFVSMLAKAGRLSAIPERLIDAASAVSGCGPAFAYLFIEALADGGVECGLTRPQAIEYAAQMLRGAAQMVLETGEHPAALKDAVCSPGGTTIAGVHALEDGGFRSLGMDAVCAAYQRTLELKK